MNAESDVKNLTFSKYVDYMSGDDKRKMDSILDRDYSRWTEDDKKFMKRMSLKNVLLFIGSDGKSYTEDDLLNMGIDPSKIGKESKPKYNTADLKILVNTYEESLKQTKEFITKNDDAYEITKILQPYVRNVNSLIYELKKKL